MALWFESTLAVTRSIREPDYLTAQTSLLNFRASAHCGLTKLAEFPLKLRYSRVDISAQVILAMFILQHHRLS